MTTIEPSYINSLVERPQEGINVELKRWINPNESAGKAKIVKCCFALYNRNGGHMVIGFDDNLQPDPNRPTENEIDDRFHIDNIQGIISNYASTVFEVKIGFGIRDGQRYPVISVPTGVKTPVINKSELANPNDSAKPFLKTDEVYFRTLNSSGKASSSTLKYKDWGDLLQICFDNREADIGRFIRRHIASEDFDNYLSKLLKLTEQPLQSASTSLPERANALLERGNSLFIAEIAQHELSEEELHLTQLPTWSIALVLDPPNNDAVSDINFLNTVLAANPRYTGWPVWIDTRGFYDQRSTYHYTDNGWQALTVGADYPVHMDFILLNATGEFYNRRVLQEDTTESKLEPGTELDAIIAIVRVAEAIAVGLSIAKFLGWPEETVLGFAFQWTGLNGRKLGNPLVSSRYFSRKSQVSRSDQVTSFVKVPISTSLSAIATYVEQAITKLFLIFNVPVDSALVEQETADILKRSRKVEAESDDDNDI